MADAAAADIKLPEFLIDHGETATKSSSITIAKNEEHNIGDCFKSLIGVIDDIMILVDKISSDKTPETAAGFRGVRTEVTDWKGYAGTKAYGLTLVQNDRIFRIDADERLTPELKDELLRFKQNTPASPVYSVPRKAYSPGKWIRHSGWYPGRVLRLFDKTRVKFNENAVHEALVFDGEGGRLTQPLDHFTDPDIFHYYDKFNKYTSLAAHDMFMKEKRLSKTAMVLRAFFILVRMYIIRPGFLDGFHGLVLAVFSSNYVFTKYTKLREKQK